MSPPQKKAPKRTGKGSALRAWASGFDVYAADEIRSFLDALEVRARGGRFTPEDAKRLRATLLAARGATVKLQVSDVRRLAVEVVTNFRDLLDRGDDAAIAYLGRALEEEFTDSNGKPSQHFGLAGEDRQGRPVFTVTDEDVEFLRTHEAKTGAAWLLLRAGRPGAAPALTPAQATAAFREYTKTNRGTFRTERGEIVTALKSVKPRAAK